MTWNSAESSGVVECNMNCFNHSPSCSSGSKQLNRPPVAYFIASAKNNGTYITKSRRKISKRKHYSTALDLLPRTRDHESGGAVSFSTGDLFSRLENSQTLRPLRPVAATAASPRCHWRAASWQHRTARGRRPCRTDAWHTDGRTDETEYLSACLRFPDGTADGCVVLVMSTCALISCVSRWRQGGVRTAVSSEWRDVTCDLASSSTVADCLCYRSLRCQTVMSVQVDRSVSSRILHHRGALECLHAACWGRWLRLESIANREL